MSILQNWFTNNECPFSVVNTTFILWRMICIDIFIQWFISSVGVITFVGWFVIKVITRDGSRTTATSKMEHFRIILNGFQPLIIITKSSILDVATVLDPPLITFIKNHVSLFSWCDFSFLCYKPFRCFYIFFWLNVPDVMIWINIPFFIFVFIKVSNERLMTVFLLFNSSWRKEISFSIWWNSFSVVFSCFRWRSILNDETLVINNCLKVPNYSLRLDLKFPSCLSFCLLSRLDLLILL